MVFPRKSLALAVVALCALTLGACSKRLGVYEAEISVAYKGKVATGLLPFECRDVRTIDWSGVRQEPETPQPIKLPDGSAISLSLDFCSRWASELAALGPGQWNQPHRFSRPMIWVDRADKPTVIESYVARAYYHDPHARIRPLSFRLRKLPDLGPLTSLWLGDRSRWQSGFLADRSTFSWYRKLDRFCGASGAAVQIRPPNPRASDDYVERRRADPEAFGYTDYETSDFGLPAYRRRFNPADPYDSSEADAFIHPLAMGPDGHFHLGHERGGRPAGLIRLEPRRGKIARDFVYDGKLYPIDRGPLFLPKSGVMLVSSVRCPRA